MSTPKKSEYMLLFRGTDWHKGLSQEIQEVVKQMYTWLDRGRKGESRDTPLSRGQSCFTKERRFRLGRPVCRI